MHTNPQTVKTWFGLDVSNPTFDAAYLAQPAKPIRCAADVHKLKARAFTRDTDGAKVFLAWVDTITLGGAHIVMESTGSYSTQLAFWLKAERPDLLISIVNAYPVKHYAAELGVRSKTDLIDARVITCYAADRQPSPNADKPCIYRELRSLSRSRHSFVEMVTKLKLQRQELMREHHEGQLQSFLLQHIDSTISHISEQVAELEHRMQQVVCSDDNVAHDVDLLDSIIGVGRIVAIGILGELGDLRDYHRSRQAASFAGVEPRLKQSGKYKGTTRMSKKGPGLARHLLYLAACATLNGDNNFSRRYQRLVDRGKQRLAAIGMLMRRMLTVMRAVLISNTPYEDCFESKRKRGTK